MANSAGDIESALVLYKRSIQCANSQGLVHDEALACERVGYALRDMKRMEEASEYFIQAKTRYASWGAHVKVVQLSAITY
jgi:hypothetical protein